MALQRAGIRHTLHAYEHDPGTDSYGLEAAQALRVPGERVFKTLVARDDSEGLLVALVPVTAQLDLKRLAAAHGSKRLAMASPADAQRATGYVVGGISPLGQKRRLPLWLDRSALDHVTVYVSAGRRGLEIELAPRDLLDLTGGRTADIARVG
ncbi:aminoacyl-tRNA deacylase [Thioalkalivibrio denitrificans]|uniref:Cys-tRNA(Pro)/Cys-tRNA(Cys) deacylase n=2 Tax=Thioalkalivibrio denitrificans TaxID=108003 RepID=A0A1V3NDQ0_9GAMM|nr:aminoacyl-tRNA deacylase [Thioalkalivibrio denitrificans]